MEYPRNPSSILQCLRLGYRDTGQCGARELITLDSYVRHPQSRTSYSSLDYKPLGPSDRRSICQKSSIVLLSLLGSQLPGLGSGLPPPSYFICNTVFVSSRGPSPLISSVLSHRPRVRILCSVPTPIVLTTCFTSDPEPTSMSCLDLLVTVSSCPQVRVS